MFVFTSERKVILKEGPNLLAVDDKGVIYLPRARCQSDAKVVATQTFNTGLITSWSQLADDI